MKLGVAFFAISAVSAQDDYSYDLSGIFPGDDSSRLRPGKDSEPDLMSTLDQILSGFDYSQYMNDDAYDYSPSYDVGDYNDILASLSDDLAGLDLTDYGEDFGAAFSPAEDYDVELPAATQKPTKKPAKKPTKKPVSKPKATPAPTQAPQAAGRPRDNDDNEKEAGRKFETFGSGNFTAAALVNASQTFCWTCHGSGRTTAETLATCAALGEEKDCLGEGEQDYCQVTLRRVNGVIKQIRSRCAQRDTCDSIRNFYDPAQTAPTRYDQCMPNSWAGRQWAQSMRNRGRESVCSICHYTATTYGASTPLTTVDDGSFASALSLNITSGDVSILGNSTNATYTITADDFDTEWATQAHNVLDSWS